MAFIVAGTIAFHLSAPPAKETTTGFSFSKLIASARRGMQGNRTYSAPPRTFAYAVSSEITELRVLGAAGPVKIHGEARADVAMQLTVTSTGPDETAAIALANKTTVTEDRTGGVLTLRVEFPAGETQTSQIVLTVPQRLGVRLDGTRETTIANVRAVELTAAARGTTTIDHIAERVTGEQNGGTITLASIAAVKMTLTRARSRLSDITGEAVLDVRDGDTEITGSRGSLAIEERRGDITIRGHKGAMKISGTDGQVRIEGATADVHLDLRRAEVDAELASGIGGSLTTSDEELRVTWRDPAGVHVDAVASNGTIDAADWTLTPTRSSIDSRLDAALGTPSPSAPRVLLRNQGANIVLKKSSKK